MKDYDDKKNFRVGDLVMNTYPYTSLHGQVGLVMGIDRLGDVQVMYNKQVYRLVSTCLEVVSEAR